MRKWLFIVLISLALGLCRMSAGLAQASPLADFDDSFSGELQDGWSEPAEMDDEGPVQRISMNFRDAALRDVIKAFSAETGLNLITTNDVEEQLLTLYIEDVTVLDALDQILKAANLSYERPPGSNIYIVHPQTDDQSLITRVYRLRYSRVSRSILARSIAAFGSITPFEAAVASNQSVEGGGSGDDEVTGIDTVIEQLLSDEGYLSVDDRTNTLIITDVPENFPRLESALAALDVQTPQILIEAELLEIALTEADHIGTQVGSSLGYTFGLTGGSRASQALWRALGLDGGAVIDPIGDDGSVGDSSVTTSGFTHNILTLPTFETVLNLIKQDTNSRVLARPKVLTLDNESAVIRLTTDEVIGTIIETSPEGGITAEAERYPTGILLSVTPQINETDFITLLVEPTVASATVSSIVDPSTESPYKDPKIRSARSLVRIRSGDTLVIGGLIDEDSTEVIQKVPFLGDLPFVGKLFTDVQKDSVSSELVIFVTPSIIKEHMPGEMASAGLPVVLPPNWKNDTLQKREQNPVDFREDAISRTLDLLE